jgi:mono/diheme cytochrome c family protein
MQLSIRAIIICSLGIGLLPGPLSAAPDSAEETVDFARQILPVLSDKCFVCHGPDGTDKDVLQLDSYDAATRDLGGYRAIDPNSPNESTLLARINSTDDPMPPADAEKQLTAAERELLTRWVRQGGEYATHWAFVPPRKEPPAGVEVAAPSAVIDQFIGNRLRQEGIDFAPEADRPTLARRAALVLTGLPPEPEQLAEYLADDSPDAYSRLVDQLLASPRFGEHQARYWLDAVRYGDTHGLHLDNRRGIFPYRNWVIHALNENLPLDQFITWQLAGDLLPHPTLEQLVATGFVRMNPSTAEGGVIPAEFQAKNNFDRVETLGTVLLGMSLTCARCHTHKYDPIPQREYYRLLAFFNSTAESPLDGNKYEYGPVLKAPSDVAAWSAWNDLETQRGRLLVEARSLFPKLDDADSAPAREWAAADDAERLAIVADPDGPFAELELHRRATELSKQIAEIEETFASTLVAQELPKPRVTRMLERGEYDLPTGEPLEPGALSVMGAFPEDAPRNRLGLARWLTSREHPLVSRVLVNQIWQRVFGAGLVRTPEDFGLQGQQPTHPKLLDWLAVELQDSHWDLKHMLRLLVTSRTFRQDSALRTGVDDPENRLFARGPRRRLSAEVIRDMALWASGLLDPTMGGEGVKPYQPGGLWSALMHPASNTKKYERDSGSALYRRSLYVYWKRTCPHPMLTVFDAPSREVSCVRRSRTTTPLQSLALLNETQRVEMSRALAERLLQERGDDTQRLNWLFTLLTCREPTAGERTACDKLLSTMRERYAAAKDDAVALLSIGDAARDEQLDPAEHAAWTQLAVTVLASDAALLLY